MDLLDSDSTDLQTTTSTVALAAGEGIERLYMPGESLFGVTGLRMRKLGWTVIPQDRGEKRRPAVVDGEVLKWKSFVEVAPTIEMTERWSHQAASANTAIILGPTSGNTFCLDIDIYDRLLSGQIEELADEVLGRTVFRRVGNDPKIALIYRVEDPQDLPANRAYTLLEPDGETRSKHMIEILSKGKPITSHGHHHTTGRYFQWLDSKPTLYGPEHAQTVTPSQLSTFIERVEQIRAIHKNTGNAGGVDVSYEYSPEDDLRVPRLRQQAGGSDWVEDPTTGLVTDGRERFLFRLCIDAVRSNPGQVQTAEGQNKIKGMVFDQFRLRAEEGKWTDGRLREEINSKVTRFSAELISGELAPLRNYTSRNGTSGKPTEKLQVQSSKGGDLDFLPPASNRTEMTKYATISATSEEKRKERALQPDRTEIAKDVQSRLTAALDMFFGEVYEDREEEDRSTLHPIHVLKAPTGAGKTTRTIRYIAADQRTKRWDEAVALGKEAPGPILFLLPTYNNIDELKTRAEVLNLDASLSDADLAEQARERGLIALDDLDTAIADLRRDAMAAGLETMTYKGKVAAGCQMVSKVRMLMDSGIGTSGLCHARVVKKDEEPEDKYCVYYNTCPAIQQRKQIAKSHVVFMAHAFFTLSIPEELKNARAVIADERIFTLFVHTTTFYLSTLSRGRKEPTLTKREKEAGVQAQEILNDRDIAAQLATDALQHGQCPAKRLADYSEKRPKSIVRGIDLVRNAARVCGSAISANALITPDMTESELAELCAKPTGAEVREEYRFWKIIQERIEALIPDLVNEGLAGGQDVPIPKKAMGDREMRIQLLLEEDVNGHTAEVIRISWRSEPNWQSSPLLLLDASASPEIIGKIFDGREVITHETPAPLNVRTIAVIDRTYANASIVAKNGTRIEREQAARIKSNLQQVIESASSTFGYGRVVCGSSVAIRRALNTSWTAPTNVDFCHFGAMRGLDFAKYHAAAVSFGRMEVPTRTIDGIVAALSYDDPVPEQPFDRNGDGNDPAEPGQALMLPLGAQILPMRNGQDAEVLVPMFPSKWARIVQQQYREEELRQFVGRLRPVYREGEAPIWIAVSKVIPDGIVVDEIVAIEDIIKIHKGNKLDVYSWRAARITDGVLQSDLLHAADPLNRAKREHWLTELTNIGLDETTGAIDASNRFSWGYTPVTYVRCDDRTKGHAFVRTEHKDIEQTLRAAFDKFLGVKLEAIEIGTPVRARQSSQQRENDWVADELGTREYRQAEEADTIQLAARAAVSGQLPDAFVRNHAPPINPRLTRKGGRKVQMTINQLAAYEGTEIMLARMKGETHEVVSSPVLRVSENFEDMGGSMADDDHISD